jgi:hypothetical protein
LKGKDASVKVEGNVAVDWNLWGMMVEGDVVVDRSLWGVVNMEIEELGIATKLVEREQVEFVEMDPSKLVGAWDNINKELTSEDFSIKAKEFWGIEVSIGAIPWLNSVGLGGMGLVGFFGELLLSIGILS